MPGRKLYIGILNETVPNFDECHYRIILGDNDDPGEIVPINEFSGLVRTIIKTLQDSKKRGRVSLDVTPKAEEVLGTDRYVLESLVGLYNARYRKQSA